MKRKKVISSVLTAAMILNLGLPAAGAVQAAENNPNLALNKTVTASSYEVSDKVDTRPVKAVDGLISTRWGTGQNKAVNEWIDVDLGGEQTVRQINIYFERTDEAQNILGYKVELKENGQYTEVYRKTTRAKQEEEILLDRNHQAENVKVTILDANGGSLNWVNVGINEIEVYGKVHEEIEETPDVNHVRKAEITASSSEAGTLGPEKVKDGNRSNRANRWASDYEQPTNNIWLKAAFEKLTLVKELRIYFFERDVAPMPCNVKSFDIKYTDANGDEQVLKEDYPNAVQGSGWSNEVILKLDTPIEARDIKICDFVAEAAEYNNVSVWELEAYSNNPVGEKEGFTTVVDRIQKDQKTIEADVDTLAMPEAAGYRIQLNGADFEQIIGKDGAIVHPLTDKTVQVSYVITDETSGETRKTKDIPYLIKGQYTQPEGMNAKPVIIPEIAEWYSETSETVSVKTLKKVVYNDDSLKAVIDEFIADYEDFTGIELTKEKGAAQAGAFNFIKEAPDKLLGEEGYTMDIRADRIVAKSESITGNMYAMQTILQMYRQNADAFQIGTMRDYPRFQTRGLLLDVARKPVSLDMMKEIVRTMRYYKMNDFQAHLSDNYIWLEDYGYLLTEDKAFDAYEAFRLESGLTNAQGQSPTAEDYSISKEEFKNFIQSQRSLGMKIVPEIDVPAHATSFTKVWPELMVKGKTSSLQWNRPLVDHIDVSKAEAKEKIKEIFDDYTKGADPTFDSETTVHIGADEFLSSYTAYRQFINDLVPHVKETNTVRMWGGLTWINDNQTQINSNAIENVEMNLWAKDWADGIEMYNMGYKLINTIDDFGYMVPNGNRTRANAYGDLLNVNRVFNEFEPNRVGTKSGYQYIPSGDEQALGAAFAIWSDNIDKRASGLTESDIYWRFFDAMPFYAEKTWAATGKEKGTADTLEKLAKAQGTGPRTNPYYQADKAGDSYACYDFEKGLEDVTANNRDLVAGKGATVTDNALNLAGGVSYVTSPIDKLGNGNELSFDIKLNQAAQAGQILFEADAPYGTHDIRIMDDGKLGFTRELYDYYFNYALPVGQKVNIKITAEQQVTKLYVNGEFAADAKGKFIHKGVVKKDNITNATFALPTERIGSKTNAVNAVIDNVLLGGEDADVDAYNKAGWTGTTDTETKYDEKEGLLRYAFDGNPGTIWHSNWQGATDKLTGNNTFYAEINFGEKYDIDQFSFTPRTDAVSGLVTKADLYIKENVNDEWKQVAQDQTFAADRSQKTFKFEAQKVQFVKFVAKSSNDGWVAVSEFDIAKTPDSGTLPEEAAGYQVFVGDTLFGRYQYNDEVTVKADAEKDGKVFAGWKVNGKIVSLDPEYTFYVGGGIVLIPTYAEEQVEKVPEALLSNVVATKQDGAEKYNIKFVGQIVLPEGYELVNAGLVWSTKEASEKPLIVGGKLNPDLTPTYIKTISTTNQFSVTIKGVPAGLFLRGRIFATVMDGDGKTQTFVYSAERKAETEK